MEKSSGEKPKPAKRRESSGHGDHVIVDIACCDGPVRFHRVLNKNYGLKMPDVDNRMREIDRNVALNRVMNENIRDQRGGNAENNSGEYSSVVLLEARRPS